MAVVAIDARTKSLNVARVMYTCGRVKAEEKTALERPFRLEHASGSGHGSQNVVVRETEWSLPLPEYVMAVQSSPLGRMPPLNGEANSHPHQWHGAQDLRKSEPHPTCPPIRLGT